MKKVSRGGITNVPRCQHFAVTRRGTAPSHPNMRRASGAMLALWRSPSVGRIPTREADETIRVARRADRFDSRAVAVKEAFREVGADIHRDTRPTPQHHGPLNRRVTTKTHHAAVHSQPPNPPRGVEPRLLTQDAGRPRVTGSRRETYHRTGRRGWCVHRHGHHRLIPRLRADDGSAAPRRRAWSLLLPGQPQARFLAEFAEPGGVGVGQLARPHRVADGREHPVESGPVRHRPELLREVGEQRRVTRRRLRRCRLRRCRAAGPRRVVVVVGRNPAQRQERVPPGVGQRAAHGLRVVAPSAAA